MAAQAQAVGLDGVSFLYMDDPLDTAVFQAVNNLTQLEVRRHDRDRAVMIANYVGKLFKGT